MKRLLIPTAEVDIYWGDGEPNGNKHAVAALWRPPLEEDEDSSSRSHPGWVAIHKCDEILSCVEGACNAAWLKTLFPEHLFASVITGCMIGDPKTDQAFFWETVRQFARIEGCAWARRMYEQREQRELAAEDLRPWWRTPEGQLEWSPLSDRGGKPEATDVLFANAHWIVTGDALEHRSGYWCEVGRLNERQGDRHDLLFWPLHLAEKSWFDVKYFQEAFVIACERLRIEIDKEVMERSFATARKKVAHHKRSKELWPAAAAKLFPEKAARETAGGPVAWPVNEFMAIGEEVRRMMRESGHGNDRDQ